jgi:DNA-binding NtrC family response regulator
MGTRPALRQGLLEQAGQRGLLLSRVDSLEAQAQEELAHALARGTFSRAGSDAYSLNPSPLFLTVECAPSVRIAEPWYSLLKEKNAVLCDWRCIKAGEIRAGALLSQVVAENGIDVGHPESLTSALDELGVEQLLSVLRLLADALSDPARLDSEAVHTAVRRAVARPLPQGTLLPDPPVPLPHLPDYMDACESEYLRHVLQRTGGNIAQSAKIAGMGRQAIYKKLSRHDIQREGTGN